MANRYQTPVPDLEGSPAPTTPGQTPRRESVYKASQWAEKLATLQEQVTTTGRLLEDLMPMVEVDREFARYFHLEERLRQVDDLQKILNNTLTMAKQMSAISWADLPVVGVQARERVLPAVTLHQALVGGRRETDARYTEAAARTHINCMIRHMLPLSDELLFGPSGPGKTIICPELILSNVGDNTKIPPGPEAKTTLSITGRADYTQIHISNWETLGEDEQGFLIEDLQAIAVVKGDGSSFPESARVCLSIIEAKSVTSSGDDLVSHLPQAIVEALVLEVSAND
ncbi:hypothetical protein M407DRAFT_6169 [Tulasnella calospora MUT 4182]|uniref:Uncharacterized protein n=1 Tax=Tulasnella calospora MUT 4182 TaxID=1051891 RepID=A0A0C3L6M2_9AGAM|nr:hypothetical protein M407DRAFT_6169 [Tulasnella calospora MUT 4182]